MTTAPPQANHRYFLRSRAPAPPPPPPQAIPIPPSARQLQIDGINLGIPRKWPGRRVRNSRASRGFHRRGVSCYRLTALQCILHMPKAMNWIMTHDNQEDIGGVPNECPLLKIGLGLDCMPCAMKELIEHYWQDDPPAAGSSSTTTSASSKRKPSKRKKPVRQSLLPNPQPFDVQHPVIQRIHTLANNSPFFGPQPNSTGGFANVQHDAEEFMAWVLRECHDITLPPAHQGIWRARYDSLFLTTIHETRSCSVCGGNMVRDPLVDPNHIFIHPGPEPAIRVIIPLGANHVRTVGDMVNRYLGDEVTNIHRPCAACARNQPFQRHFQIDAAPEYLVIQPTGGFRHDIQPDDFLDLTQFQSHPSESLRYRLISTINHRASHVGGHYSSTAQRHPQIFGINDDLVTRQNRRFLLSNPQRHYSSTTGPRNMKAKLFVYERQY